MKQNKDLEPILSTLKPYKYRFETYIYSFLMHEKECVLIPFPHVDMKHNFLLEHQYGNIDYSFSKVGNETRISFFGTDEYNLGNRYNVYLDGHYVVVPLSKMSELAFCQTPNSNFTYLVAIPF